MKIKDSDFFGYVEQSLSKSCSIFLDEITMMTDRMDFRILLKSTGKFIFLQY